MTQTKTTKTLDGKIEQLANLYYQNDVYSDFPEAVNTAKWLVECYGEAALDTNIKYHKNQLKQNHAKTPPIAGPNGQTKENSMKTKTEASTIAEQFAALLGNDGQVFETQDGLSFDELADKMGAIVTYSKRDYSSGTLKYVDGFENDHVCGDPVQYQFTDGSAVVVAGDAWDFEGQSIFLWSGK